MLLLRRRPLGYATAAGELLFLAQTCLPILVTPFVARARGHAVGWAVTVPIAVVLVLTSVVLLRTLRATAVSERSLVSSPG